MGISHYLRHKWVMVVVLIMAAGLLACNSSKQKVTQDEPSPKPVQYDQVALSGSQAADLGKFAEGETPGAVVAEEVGMVVNPQPSDLPAGKLLVAISYGTCGTAKLGHVYLKGTQLVVQVLEDKPSDPNAGCGGSVVSTGLRLSVANKSAITDVRVIKG